MGGNYFVSWVTSHPYCLNYGRFTDNCFRLHGQTCVHPTRVREKGYFSRHAVNSGCYTHLPIRRILLEGCFLPGTWHHFLSTCALNRVHKVAVGDGVKTMVPRACSTLVVALKLNKKELHRFFPLLGNTKSLATFFAAYGWTARPS